MLWLLSQDQTAKTVAESTGYSWYWVGQIAKRHNAERPGGIVNRQYTWARLTPLLLNVQLAVLRQVSSSPAFRSCRVLVTTTVPSHRRWRRFSDLMWYASYSPT